MLEVEHPKQSNQPCLELKEVVLREALRRRVRLAKKVLRQALCLGASRQRRRSPTVRIIKLGLHLPDRALLPPE